MPFGSYKIGISLSQIIGINYKSINYNIMKKSLSFYLFGLFLLLFATQSNAVTFNVTVPDGTVKCFVAGAFNSWSTTTSIELTKIDATHFNLDAPDVTSVSGGFKYLCGPGPGWTYVEKNADGSERSNRTEATANDVVARWAALYAPDLVPGPVTLIVTVPENTPDNKVYIYGSFQGWIVEEALQLTKTTATQYTITIPDVTQFNYKILCGKSTTYVEVDASGADIPDRNAASSTPTINIIVPKWKNVNAATVNGVTYLEENISFSPLNGIRNIWVYLPPDYATNPDKRYPVLYMQDGQHVFAEEIPISSVDYPVGSWDVATTLNKMYGDGKNVGIVIAIDKTPEYKSEYSPWKNNDFSQSGTGNEYLQAVINNIIPYVNSHYRTLTGPDNTAIAGSDMGGLISYYAALKHQSVFGKAGIFSPSVWFNKAELNAYLASWTKNESSKMYIITGDKEGTTMNDDAQLLYDATKAKGFTDENIKREIFKGGIHHNSSWATQFRRVYAYLFNIDDIIPPPDPTPGYQFMSHSATTGVACSGEETFVASTYFPTGFDATPTNVMAYIKTVPANITTTYNWNINDSGNCVGANLFSTNKSVYFNSTKSTETWIRAIVSADKSVLDLAASSTSFRVKKANGTFVNMTRTTATGAVGEDDTYTVSAEVDFTGSNKNFEIHSGNANDGSDQGSVCGLNDTYPLFVTATCIKTQIIYSFKTNKVVVKCLDEGIPVPNYQFMSHSATSPNVQCSGLEPFVASAYYPTGIDATPLNVMTYIKTIPVEVKTIYYWNINEGSDCAGANLYATNKSVGFSSSKAYESWTRAIIKDDKTVLDVNASSAYFRVKKADATLVVMTRTKADGTAGEDDTYTVSAEVTFTGANKNFEIRFGSVNSGSVQPSVVGTNDTYPLSVLSTCTKAQIIYSFKTNKVVVKWLEGEIVDSNYQFMNHSASTGVECTGTQPFQISTYYSTGIDAPSNVMTYIKTIPADVTTAYNWNINGGGNCSGTNLFSTNKAVVFNSSKNTESWIRAVVKEDKTVLDIAASALFFSVKKANASLVVMTRTKADGTAGEDDSYTLSAEVPFIDAIKNFEICYGNVNDGSVQTSLVGANDTYPLSVSSVCLKAQISYSFKTNKVTIKCLDDGTIAQRYQFMSHSATTGVECIGNEPLVNSVYYPTGTDITPTNVMTYIKTVPVEVKTQYFWNINEGSECTGANLYATNKSVGFSSSKGAESWIRAIVNADKTVLDVAASSIFFRVKKADATLVVMSRTKADGTAGSDDSFTVSANVSFPTANKNFEIRFGSVNSGSIQASLVGSSDTYPLSVPANCTNAQIIYSFKTNQVKIVEITDPVVLPTISYLKAIPSVCQAGTPVTVSGLINDATGYDLSYTVSQNYGTYVNQPFTINAQNELIFNFTSSTGIYFIQLKAKKGIDAEIVFPQICVKVLSGTIDEKTLSGNPYQNVNWATVGKYKGTFHVHTDWSSDATLTADAVVDLYHSKNYKILPLTNHDFNSYPWTLFSMFKPTWKDRDPAALGMLTFPAIELSANNHHNDFFTGRNDDGANLEQSFTKTEEMGGLQQINHPGQYWSIGNTYTGLEKNSAAWHADNFKRHASLIGLEVYNAGNKHVSDRILWDEILTLTMPQRPVWGYSNDDFHNLNMAFFNYEYMLMDELTISALKVAMKTGKSVFSYEYGASGNALAPSISNITVNESNKTITITTPDNDVSWICGTEGSGSTRKSAVIGYGKTFFYDGFKGSYVRALIKNVYGETCTQPFGFDKLTPNGLGQLSGRNNENAITVYPNPATNKVFINSIDEISQVQLVNLMGQTIKSFDTNAQSTFELNLQNIKDGVYLLRMKSGTLIQNKMIIVKR